MRIRPMEIMDLQQVCAIEMDTFSDPWSRESFQEGIENEQRIYFVAEEEGHIFGYCGMWAIAGEGQITNVAVERQSRGKGIAGRMFSKFLQCGIENGLTSFTLEVRVSNHGAIALYEKFGFQSAGIRKDFYDHPKEDAMIMWKYV